MVHPGEAADRELLAREGDGSGRGQPGEREVVGDGPRVAGHLAADPVPAVDDHRLPGLQGEAKGRVGMRRGQRLDGPARSARAPLDAPVAVPDPPLPRVGAGEARAGTVDPLGDEEAFLEGVGHREVREPDLVEVPRGGLRCGDRARPRPRVRLRPRSCPCPRAGPRPPEERELEAEVPPRGGGEVPGVVPPLGVERRMREVVARELERVAGEDPSGLGPDLPLRAPRVEGGPERGREHAEGPPRRTGGRRKGAAGPRRGACAAENLPGIDSHSWGGTEEVLGQNWDVFSIYSGFVSVFLDISPPIPSGRAPRRRRRGAARRGEAPPGGRAGESGEGGGAGPHHSALNTSTGARRAPMRAG